MKKGYLNDKYGVMNKKKDVDLYYGTRIETGWHGYH